MSGGLESARRGAVSRRAARAVCEVRLRTAPRQNAPDRIWPLRGQESKRTWRRETGDVRLPWLHAHLPEEQTGMVFGAAPDDTQEDEREAPRGERQPPAEDARPHTGARSMARVCDPRTPAIFRCPRQSTGTRNVSTGHHVLLAAHAQAPEPNLPDHVAADESLRAAVASTRTPVSPLSESASCRLTRGKSRMR